MQQQNILQSWAAQLLAQSPVLMALILMLVMSLVLWGRYPRPCLLAFLGAGLLLITAVVFPALSMYVIQRRPTGSTLGATLSVLGLVANLIRAVAYVLLTGAIFAGRVRPTVSGFPVTPATGFPGGGSAAPR